MASPELQVSTLERKSPAAAGSADYGEKSGDELLSVLVPDARERSTEIVIGERELRKWFVAIQEVRLRCGQQDDRTTDPDYFIRLNSLKDRRVAAVLIRHKQQLEACVLFFEHCRFEVGLGLFRGGDALGESLVAGADALHVFYVQLATQALLRNWRIHGVSLTVKGSEEECVALMGPADKYRRFSGKSIARKLPLESTYQGMLASLGPRTRRSLQGKRQQLEKSANVVFCPALDPEAAIAAMLELQPKSLPRRIAKFYQARQALLREHPEFFCMGMRLPDGPWLSILSGWRQDGVTYIDFQMNDQHYKKESLSAVLRAFMLEHEIGLAQQLINFVGGTSLLLRRYCQPLELCTDAYLWRPSLRATVLKMVAPRLRPGGLHERAKAGADTSPPDTLSDSD